MKKLLLLVPLLLGATCSQAEPPLPLLPVKDLSQNDHVVLRWAIDPWKPSTLTKRLQKQVDQDFKKNRNHAMVVERLRVKAFETSKSFPDQFVWAYADYKLLGERSFVNSIEQLRLIRDRLDLISSFASNASPQLNQTVEYARLRYLSQQRPLPMAGLVWRNVAIRLVKAYPHDFEIKWFAYQNLNPLYVPQDLPIYMAWMQEFERKHPNKPGVAEMRPQFYGGLYGKTLAKGDIPLMRKAQQRAIAEWQRYYKSVKTDRQRKWALREIETLRDVETSLEKKKANAIKRTSG